MTTHKGWSKINTYLSKVYGEATATLLVKKLQKLALKFTQKRKVQEPHNKLPNLYSNITHKDAALIIYANSIVDKSGGTKSLKVLQEFLDTFNLADVFTVVHILPFYPWDTDRGFSVKNYYKVHKNYGTWKDIKSLSKKVRLMFDFVLNHASIENPLVQNALIERHLSKDDPRYKKYKPYKNFVIAYSEKDKPSLDDLKKLARPRPTPVLTPYIVYELKDKTLKAVLGDKPLKEDKNKLKQVLGKGYVWTTFSRPKNPDGSQATRQVDLNYANPNVFLEAIKIMLFYIERGATFLRLDAVAYMWKELGTTSIHHPKTHLLLKAMREFLNIVAPNVVFIAEVNEPQNKAFTYLGTKEEPESDLAYQFAHLPMAIYNLAKENAKLYADWFNAAKKAEGRQFITILGSHDGLGLKPVRDFLTPKQINELVDILVNKHKGLPNYAYLPGGKQIVYEVCATPWNLINTEDTPHGIAFKRYLLVVALGLMLKAIPAFYFNGIFGAKNYLPQEGLDENRTINRQIFDKQELFPMLQSGLHAKVLTSIKKLLKVRQQYKYFSPWQYFPRTKVLNNKRVLAFIFEENHKPVFLTIYNFSSLTQKIDLSTLGLDRATSYYDVIKQNKLGSFQLVLKPYAFAWLRVDS